MARKKGRHKNAISAQKVQKILQLRRLGRSYTSIGAEVGISKDTVARYVREAESKGEVFPYQPSGRPRKGEQPKSTTVELPTDFELGDEAGNAARHVALQRRKAGHLAESAAERHDYAAFDRMAKLEARLAAELAGMVPPEPPDPAADPANVAARDEVRERIARLSVRHAEKLGQLCEKCGEVMAR